MTVGEDNTNNINGSSQVRAGITFNYFIDEEKIVLFDDNEPIVIQGIEYTLDEFIKATKIKNYNDSLIAKTLNKIVGFIIKRKHWLPELVRKLEIINGIEKTFRTLLTAVKLDTNNVQYNTKKDLEEFYYDLIGELNNDGFLVRLQKLFGVLLINNSDIPKRKIRNPPLYLRLLKEITVLLSRAQLLLNLEDTENLDDLKVKLFLLHHLIERIKSTLEDIDTIGNLEAIRGVLLSINRILCNVADNKVFQANNYK